MPTKKRVKTFPNYIREGKIKEANTTFFGVPEDGRKKNFTRGTLDENEWQELVSDYTTALGLRSGEGGRILTDDGKELYDWEIEQQLTHDFVNDVRSGQSAAGAQAKSEGITDMVWVAIVDDKTDECCAWRDGLTTKEIEAKLNTTHKDDECRSIVPPAHFNCRCDIAPTSDAIETLDNSKEMEDFDEWLRS